MRLLRAYRYVIKYSTEYILLQRSTVTCDIPPDDSSSSLRALEPVADPRPQLARYVVVNCMWAFEGCGRFMHTFRRLGRSICDGHRGAGICRHSRITKPPGPKKVPTCSRHVSIWRTLV